MQQYRYPLELLADHLARHPGQNYLHQPVDRVWRSFSWREFDEQARRIAAGLLAQGFAPGERVAILSKNCAEWFIADFAIMMAGLVSVPIYPTAAAPTIRYVLEHSEARAVFLGKLDATAPAEEAIPAGVLRIAMPYPTAQAGASWSDWLARHAPLASPAPAQPDDPFTLVYTSGSTGVPKGVVLSYRNMAAQAKCLFDALGVRPGERVVSYLPLAHIAERAAVEHVSLLGDTGGVYFVESLDTFAEDLRHARPTIFGSVPRLWTRFQSQILARMSDARLQRLLRIPLIGRLVARRIRKAMGLDQARLFVSGTAPIAPALLDWFARLGMPIGEVWGMTETAGAACLNLPCRPEWLGTIGRPVECVEMKLSPGGEIMIRGESIFREYYRNPEATAASFSDGWLLTGDVGELRPDGAWRIIGRVKEQFKTAKGKYVAPVPIESLLAANPVIEQVCVMGSGRKQPVALAVLAAGHGLSREDAGTTLASLLADVNGRLESHETLDHIVVCAEPWSIENDLLTPTLKLRRERIEARYTPLIERMALDAPVVWEPGR